MAGKYDFYKDHDLRHYTEIVYDEITKKLRDDEYIIHKGFEHDDGNSCNYNVCYISNYGLLYYSSFRDVQLSTQYKPHQNRHGFVNASAKKPVGNTIIAGKNEKLPETIINAIKLETFNSGHYSKLRTELDKYIQMATDIINAQSTAC